MRSKDFFIFPLVVGVLGVVAVAAWLNGYLVAKTATMVFGAVAFGIGLWLSWALMHVGRLIGSLKDIDRLLESIYDKRTDAGNADEARYFANWFESSADGKLEYTLFYSPDEIQGGGDGRVNRFFRDEIFRFSARDALGVIKPAARVGVEHVPALFTAIGILFTFFGLIAGVNDVSLGGQSTEMMNDLNNLFDGVSVAFYSSLGGVFLSFVALAVSRHRLSRLEQVCADVRNMAIDLDREESPTRVLTRMETSSQRADQKLARMIDLNEDQNAKLGQLGTDIATTLDEVLSKALQEQVAAPLQQVSANIEHFADTQLETHAEVMDEVMTDFQQSFDETLGGRFTQLNQTLERVIEWQEETKAHYDVVNRNLETSVERQNDILDVQTEWLEEFRDEVEKREHQVQRSIGRMDDFVDAVEALSKDIEDSGKTWKETSEGIQAAQEGLQEAATQMVATATQLQTASSEASGDFVEGVARLEAALTQNMDELEANLAASFEQTSTALEQLRNEIGLLPDQYKELVREIRRELHGGIEDTFKEFDRSTAEIVNRLGGSYIDMQAVMDDLHESVEGLSGRIGSVAELDTILERLDGSVEHLARQLGELEKVDDSVRQFDKSVDQLSANLNELQQAQIAAQQREEAKEKKEKKTMQMGAPDFANNPSGE